MKNKNNENYEDEDFFDLGDGVIVPKVEYYKTESNNYVKNDGGAFYVIRKGKLKYDQYFLDILFSDILAERITREDFEDALDKSARGVEGYR